MKKYSLLALLMSSLFLLTLAGCGSPSDSTPSSIQMEAPTTETVTEPPVWIDNVLMERKREDFPYIFRMDVPAEQISGITFLDSLSTMPASAWDISQDQSGRVMAWSVPEGEYLHLYIGAEGGINARHCDLLFASLKNLKTLDFGGAFHTDYTTSMVQMFLSCEALTQLDLSGLNTSQVQDMSEMFYGCKFVSLDLSVLDTGSVRNMDSMFALCYYLEYLDISGFDLSQLRSAEDMFKGCPKLLCLICGDLDMSKLPGLPDTVQFTPLPQWYGNQLADFPVEREYDAEGNLPLMEDFPAFGMTLPRKMVRQITFLDTLADMPDSAWDVSRNQNRQVMAWEKPDGDLIHLYIAAEGGINPRGSCNGIFTNFVNLEAIHFGSAFHTEYVDDMGSMFEGCKSLDSLDLSSFYTSRVTNMNNMFISCESLTDLDLSGFDTHSTEKMSNMFIGCKSLIQLDLSSFNTSLISGMSSMFAGCESLLTLDLSSFDTSNVTDMAYMFDNCTSLEALDLSSFDTSNVTDMAYMFNGCESLRNVDVSDFDTSRVTDVSFMFYHCWSLCDNSYHFQQDLDNWDLSSIENCYLFGGHSFLYRGFSMNSWIEMNSGF